MGKRDECRKTKATDVTTLDRHGAPIVLGAIVEIAEHPRDRYRGLHYVVGFEIDPFRGTKLLLAATRWEKWDFKVSTARISLRCNDPNRVKGE